MAVRFDCPSCKANYEVADDLAGKMIMCRICKKRGPVQSLSAPATAAMLPAAGQSAALSRRNVLPLLGLFLASLGAIGVGALLARQPWARGKERPEEGPGWRRFGPPPNDEKKDNKGSAV